MVHHLGLIYRHDVTSPSPPSLAHEPTTTTEKILIYRSSKPKSVASVIYLDVVNNYTVIQHVKQILDDFVVSAVSSQNVSGKCAKSQVLFLPTPSESFFPAAVALPVLNQ